MTNCAKFYGLVIAQVIAGHHKKGGFSAPTPEVCLLPSLHYLSGFIVNENFQVHS